MTLTVAALILVAVPACIAAAAAFALVARTRRARKTAEQSSLRDAVVAVRTSQAKREARWLMDADTDVLPAPPVVQQDAVPPQRVRIDGRR